MQLVSVTDPPRDGLPGKNPGPSFLALPNVYEAKKERPLDSRRRTDAWSASYFDDPMYITAPTAVFTAPPKPGDEITVARLWPRVPTYASMPEVLLSSSRCRPRFHCSTLVFLESAGM